MEKQIRTFNISETKTQAVICEINSYISQVPISESIKKNLLSFDFINDNPSYYIDYPYLFVSNPQNKVKINKLCIAGALYYQSIIMIDRILDKDCQLESLYPLISTCQEETIKILGDIIGTTSSFWTKWNMRKEEYIHAFKTDKTHNIHSFEDFENHADNKSALGKIAIDALWSLEEIPSNELYTVLLEIHKLYYCAFQILDDISDINEDFVKGQFNVVIWQMKEAVSAQELPKATLESAEMMTKMFYLSDIRNGLYHRILEYIDQAINLSIKCNLLYLVEEECRLWNTTISQCLNIDAYIKSLEISLSLSNTTYRRENVTSTIVNGISFIYSAQEENGSWIDFCNNAGTSDTWSTAFVLFTLNEIGESNPKATNYLLEHKGVDLWGYNTSWIADNDSSTIGLLALQPSTNIDKELSVLTNRFNQDGGVSTYYNEQILVSSLSNIRNWSIEISGWMQSHFCVSTSALLLLEKANYKGAERDALIKYIKLNISKGIQAYWWIDNIYVLFFLTKSNYYLKDSTISEYLKKEIECKIQNYESYKHSAFYKSLLLYILCFNKNTFQQHTEIIDAIVQELLNTQLEDGSWKESNFMCIPSTENLTPDKPERWEISDRGINIRAHEFHRLFTTSLVVLALNQYSKYQNE